MIKNQIARAFVSLLYCAWGEQPTLLYLWVLAGTPVSLSVETLASSAPVLAGSLVPVLARLVVSWVWGYVNARDAPLEPTEALSGEANRYPRDY